MFVDYMRIYCLGECIRQILLSGNFNDNNFFTRYSVLNPQLRNLDVSNLTYTYSITIAALASDLIAMGFVYSIPMSAAKDLIPNATPAAFTIP